MPKCCRSNLNFFFFCPSSTVLLLWFLQFFFWKQTLHTTSTLFEWMNIKLCSERWAFRSFFKIMNVDNSLKDGIFQSGKFSKFLQSIFSLLKAKLSSIVDLKGKNKKCKLNKTKKSCPKFSLLLSKRKNAYSQVPIKRVGPNKREGWIF